jgi:3-isopropylmalate/(R)-2-methylmalate dehydratase small subunit
MRAFHSLTSRAAVLDRPDIDTDQIAGKELLQRIGRTGFGEYLFHEWRKDPDFELNLPACAGARILLTGPNFGCGSSREHAAWALQDYGFDVLIAPSFGDIFFSNAVQVGLVPVRLPRAEVRELMSWASSGAELTVDLESQTVAVASGPSVAFEMEAFVRHCLLNGLDSIALTLQHEGDIHSFEARTTQPVATTSL